MRQMGLDSGLLRTLTEEQLAWATIRVADHLPDIIEDIVLAAKGRTETCARCDGEGEANGKVCFRCVALARFG